MSRSKTAISDGRVGSVEMVGEETGRSIRVKVFNISRTNLPATSCRWIRTVNVSAVAKWYMTFAWRSPPIRFVQRRVRASGFHADGTGPDTTPLDQKTHRRSVSVSRSNVE